MAVAHDWDTSQPLLRKEKGFTGHNSGEDCLEYESQTTKKNWTTKSATYWLVHTD